MNLPKLVSFKLTFMVVFNLTLSNSIGNGYLSLSSLITIVFSLFVARSFVEPRPSIFLMLLPLLQVLRFFGLFLL